MDSLSAFIAKQYIPLKSSNLKGFRYDPATERMWIEFLNKGLYLYEKVPIEHAVGLMRASSAGGYFHDHIRDLYKTTKEN